MMCFLNKKQNPMNLFTNFYIDKKQKRQDELDACFFANFYNPALDTVNVLIEKSDFDFLPNIQLAAKNEKCNIIFIEKQPTLNNFFKATELYPNDINIISNTDMIMDKVSLIKLKQFNFKNHVLALSRWDFISEKLFLHEATHYNRADSQDTWIKKGAFKQLPQANIYLGWAGIDNVLARLFTQAGYEVINPSLTIKTYHYHLSNIRNYLNPNNIKRLPPPYKLVQPTTLM